MKKLLLVASLGVGVLVLALVAGVVFAGSLARTAIEQGGTYALGVETKLADADLGLFSGRFGMSDLSVANPEGFESPHFLHLDSANFEVSLGSLSSDVVEAPLLRIDGLEVSLEKRKGHTNYGRILDRLQSLQGDDTGKGGKQGKGTGKDSGEEQAGKQFIIHQVVLSNIVAHVDLLPQGGELTKATVKIPEIRLEDVGQDGESLAEVVGELTQVLLAAIAEAGGDVIPKELLGDLKQGLGALQGRGYELSKGIVTQVEDLGAGLGESLGEDAGELLNDASKKIGSGLNKLLDGK